MIGECVESGARGAAITRSCRKVWVAVVDGHDGRECGVCGGSVDELTAAEGHL